MQSATRSTSWSVTWYPPTDSMDFELSKREIEQYVARPLAPGWKVEGQMEKCPETGRYHYQALLKTPQYRWKGVVDAMTFMEQTPHVEVPKNKVALQKYVHKVETRAAEIAPSNSIPSLFEYQDIIAAKWSKDDFDQLCQTVFESGKFVDFDEMAMQYLDSLVAADIESGRRGAEYIAVNPMWRSSWKKFWRSIIKRHARSSDSSSCTPAPLSAPSDWSPAEDATQGSGQQSP